MGVVVVAVALEARPGGEFEVAVDTLPSAFLPTVDRWHLLFLVLAMGLVEAQQPRVCQQLLDVLLFIFHHYFVHLLDWVQYFWFIRGLLLEIRMGNVVLDPAVVFLVPLKGRRLLALITRVLGV